MNISAITKLLFSRSTSSRPSLLLHKPYTCALSSFAKHYWHHSKILPAAFDQPLSHSHGKPALYHGTKRTSTHSNGQQTNAMTIWKDIKAITSSPLPALVIGLAGLVPFILPPAYMLMTQTFVPKLCMIQNVFGACTLCFVGGVRWGYVIPENSSIKVDWVNMVYSVCPCMVAWTALMLPQTAATLTIMAGVAGASYIDALANGYPPWYKGLRFALSFAALVSLWTVLLCKATLSPHVRGELDASHVNKFGGSLSLRAAESSEEDQKAEEESGEKVVREDSFFSRNVEVVASHINVFGGSLSQRAVETCEDDHKAHKKNTERMKEKGNNFKGKEDNFFSKNP